MKMSSFPTLCLLAVTMTTPVVALAEIRGPAEPVKPVLSDPSRQSGQPVLAGRDSSGMRFTGNVGPRSWDSDLINRVEPDHRPLMVEENEVVEPARHAGDMVQNNATDMVSSGCENTDVNTVIQRSSARSVQAGSRRQTALECWVEDRTAAGPGNPAPCDEQSQSCHHPF